VKKKTNISINGVQVAAIPYSYEGQPVTIIVKKTKAGHFFVNCYLKGVKAMKAYYRESGSKLAAMVGMTLEQLNNKLFDSTATIENRKRLSRILNYPRSAA
jgi:hypothetical protein